MAQVRSAETFAGDADIAYLSVLKALLELEKRRIQRAIDLQWL